MINLKFTVPVLQEEKNRSDIVQSSVPEKHSPIANSGMFLLCIRYTAKLITIETWRR